MSVLPTGRSYRHPAEVVADPALSHAERVDLLRAWKLEEIQRMVAEEENMGGGPPSQLRAVNAALKQLGELPGVRATPTKHGSL